MSHIDEPVSCEALLAEALEVLAKFPARYPAEKDVLDWYWSRALPTIKLINEFTTPDSVTPST